VLRHHPEKIGLVLDGAGWVDIDVLLAALARHGRPCDLATLARLVEHGTEEGPPAGTHRPQRKKRLELKDGRIRAAQGHSIPVDLALDPAEPPATLYHGTAERFLDRIFVEGLTPQARHHVHLSPDVPTATAVGSRRGKPVILAVDAARMHAAGLTFYRAANGVWLTDTVPPGYLRTLSSGSGRRAPGSPRTARETGRTASGTGS
jgi:putative RNA 2'-phosphotransferase